MIIRTSSAVRPPGSGFSADAATLGTHPHGVRHLCFLVLAALFFLGGCAPRNATYTATPDTVQTMQMDGYEIAYRTVGQGSPLLLIMGYGATMDSWDPVLVGLLASTGHRVVMFDNRGMGYSTASQTKFSMDGFARDAAALLDHLRIGSADVLGWSMGSIIAQEMALSFPEKIRKVVLYATDYENKDVLAVITNPKTFGSEQEGPVHLFPKAWIAEHKAQLHAIPQPARPVDPAIVKRQLQAIADWPGTMSRLARLEQPTLLFIGQDDIITKPGKSLDICTMVPGSWLVRIKGGGHGLMFQDPQDMARIVGTFLRTEQNLIQPLN